MRLLLLLLLSSNAFAVDVTGDWHGQLDIQGMKLRISFHLSKEGDKYTSTMDSPDQEAMGLATSTTFFDGETLKISMENIGAEFNGELKDNVIDGTFNQAGMKMPLLLSKKEVAEVKQKPRPQDPVKPYPYTSENVHFTNIKADNIKLAGTLTLPKNVENPPVVVLISGSGPQNRNEEIKAFNHRPFLVWSDYLTRHGIAVLRFDDRGVGESEGTQKDATSADFATDTQAAFDYLKTRGDVIDTKKIGLMGHSEGGLIAPMVASTNKDVAFIIMLAGPGVDGAEVLLSQSKRAAELAGENNKNIELNQKLSKHVFQMVKKEADLSQLSTDIIKYLTQEKQKYPKILGKDLSEQQIKQQAQTVSSPWMTYFIRTNPTEFLEKVTCPVLAINGGLDFQVIVDLNLPPIEKALIKAGNKDVTVKEFKGLNHLFQTADTGALNEYSKIEETVSPIVLKTVSDWIVNRFNKKKESYNIGVYYIISAGILLVTFGFLRLKFPPKKPGNFYRYPPYFKRKDTHWGFVQIYYQKQMIKSGLILLLGGLLSFFMNWHLYISSFSAFYFILIMTWYVYISTVFVSRRREGNPITLSKNNLYWMLQIAGWALPACLNSWGKYISNANLSLSYIIAEGVLFFIGGILSTTVLRFHINKDVDFDNIQKTPILKILRHFISSIIIFFMVMVIAIAINIIINRPPHATYHVTKLMLFSTVLNIALYVFFWMILYVAIKTTMHLRQAKIKSLKLQTELKESQLNTLKGQINPHFMFNSLNNIRGLILEDKHKARDMITCLSEMLRYSLNKDKVDTINLEDELEMVDNYIALSKIQLENRLDFDKNIDENVLTAQIPPMIIQMLIENAIKHGIANQAQGGVVQLNIHQIKDRISIEVCNTGKLIKNSDSTQLGLNNIQKRLKLMYKNQASFQLTEKEGQVIATILMPYES